MVVVRHIAESLRRVEVGGHRLFRAPVYGLVYFPCNRWYMMTRVVGAHWPLTSLFDTVPQENFSLSFKHHAVD